MLNWILTAIGFILVLLIIRQLQAAVQIFYNLYSQLIALENVSLPAEPDMILEAASTTALIPATAPTYTSYETILLSYGDSMPESTANANTICEDIIEVDEDLAPYDLTTKEIPASVPSPSLDNTPSSSCDERDEDLKIYEAASLYVASLQSTRFHRLECSSVKRIRANNRQHFNSREEAIESGYNPCNTCHP